MSSSVDAENLVENVKKRAKKPYEPRKNTASYAVLVAMYFESQRGQSAHTKESISALASRWTNEEIIKNRKGSRFKANDMYDGWSSVTKTLIKTHQLIGIINRKPSANIMQNLFFLTEKGEEVAARIVQKYTLTERGPLLVPAMSTLSGSFERVEQNMMSSQSQSQEKEDSSSCMLRKRSFNESDTSSLHENVGSSTTTNTVPSSRSVALSLTTNSLTNKRSKSAANQDSDVEFIDLTENSQDDEQKDLHIYEDDNPQLFHDTTVSSRSAITTSVLAKASVISEPHSLIGGAYKGDTSTLLTASTVSISNSVESVPAQKSVVGQIWDDITPLDWNTFSPSLQWCVNEAENVSRGNKVSDEFDFILAMDLREKKKLESHLDSVKNGYIDNLRQLGVNMMVDARDLKVGDFMWVAKHKRSGNEIVLDLVAERKTYEDMWQSITGHGGVNIRYNEQKRRMVFSGISRRYYVLEGDDKSFDDNIQTKVAVEKKISVVYGSQMESQIHGFQLIKTANARDTIVKLLSLTRQICLSPELGQANAYKWMTSELCRKISFADFQKEVIKPHSTIGQVSQLMLYQIAKVGKAAVESITMRFPTMVELITALRDQQSQNADVNAYLQKEASISKEKARKVCTALLSKY
jgi:ERCC4-type nuclease